MYVILSGTLVQSKNPISEQTTLFKSGLRYLDYTRYDDYKANFTNAD